MLMQSYVMRFCLLVLLLVPAGVLLAQVQDVDNPTLDIPEVDTTFTASPPPTSSRKEGLLSVFYGHPGRAAFYGLIIPGGGQWYNKRYWKVPLAVGVDVGAAYNLVDASRQYRRWNDALIRFTAGEISEFEDRTSARAIKIERDAFRRRREYGILIMAGAHIFTFMEAFIDRHLIDFDVSDDLTIGVDFGESSNSMAFGVFYRL